MWKPSLKFKREVSMYDMNRLGELERILLPALKLLVGGFEVCI